MSIYRLKALFQKSRQMSDREKQEEEGKCQQEVSGDTTPTLGARGSQRLATQRKRQATQLLIAWRHLDTARRFMQVFTTVLMACAWRWEASAWRWEASAWRWEASARRQFSLMYQVGHFSSIFARGKSSWTVWSSSNTFWSAWRSVRASGNYLFFLFVSLPSSISIL